MKFNRLFAAVLFGIFSTSALADRVVTDQLDRQVTIPDHIQRAVVLQHQTLNIAVQLDATKQIVGLGWFDQLYKHLELEYLPFCLWCRPFLDYHLGFICLNFTDRHWYLHSYHC